MSQQTLNGFMEPIDNNLLVSGIRNHTMLWGNDIHFVFEIHDHYNEFFSYTDKEIDHAIAVLVLEGYLRRVGRHGLMVKEQ